MPEKKIEELLKKYLDGTATPEEERLVNDWYRSLSDKGQVRLSHRERTLFRNAYWSAIRPSIGSASDEPRSIWPRLLAVAASISIFLVISFYALPLLLTREVAEVALPSKTEVIVNDAEETKSLTLPDGSRIRLFANSTVKYGEDFNLAERKIHLSGQAFFEIVHNAEKPFYVFANQVVTKVLGTSFIVTAFPGDERVTVAVTTGKVSVYAPHAKNGSVQLSPDEEIILTPNQQAVYTRADHKVSRTLVKEPQLVITEEEAGMVRFEGAPVPEVFEALERMYNVDIEFNESVFATCAITTSVSGRDMFERIDVICEIIGASYTVEDTTIKIIGTGCD